MVHRQLELAHELCKLVGAPNLFGWLEAPPETPAAELQHRLREKRKFLQGMQANPKWKAQALFVIKHYAALDAVLADPQAHLDDLRGRHEDDAVPAITRALDSVLSDGDLSEAEAGFVRKFAAESGLSPSRFEALLAERAAAHGVTRAPKRTPTAVPDDPTNEAESGSAPILDPEPPPNQRWWDANFTRLLLGSIPSQGVVLDLAAGLGWSALTLLSERPELRWVGLVPDGEHAQFARRTLQKTAFSARTDVRIGAPHALPFDDDSVETVLSVMCMHEFGAPEFVFAEAARVLKTGGQLIAVEPDSFGHRFYFGGNLEEVNVAFQRLRKRVAQALAPSSVALGPHLVGQMLQAGLRPTQTTIHAMQGAQLETAARFCRRLRGLAQAMCAAGKIPTIAVEATAVDHALHHLERTVGPETVDFGCHLLPAFLTVAAKT